MPNLLVPLLVVRDAPAALAFYARAFGADLVVRYDNEVLGTISHADLTVGDARFSVTEELRAWNSDAPPSLGGSPVVLQLGVDDATAALERAVLAGAEIVFPLGELCGERMARVRDPFGHLWVLTQRIEELTPEENQRRRNALFAELARAQRASPTSRAEAHESTAFELARRIRARECSSVELTRHFIDRIERLDGAINAVVVRDFERALEAAREADAALASDDGAALGPLHGVPLTLKESFDVAGLTTTCGALGPADPATSDSEVAARLRAAGAVLLGKTNVSAMLADFHTENPVFGRTANPCDPTRGVGGSSGGAAAALAAGLTALDVGSDLGGSVRNPAHYCGVFGHKPTFGLVSLAGHGLPTMPRAPDMAVAGPLARSAEDLALALEVLAGRPLTRAPARPARRVAVWPTDPFAPVDDEIAAAAQSFADAAARRGMAVSDRARPALDLATHRRAFAALVGAIVAGHAPPPDAEAERRAIRRAWRAFFEEWDVLVCPVMPTTARPHDEPPPLTQVLWSSLASLSYLPATAFPAGRSREGLPIGLQAISAEGADATSIELASLANRE
ncbi:MAG: VOC family protein [Labilithrix sp.]|nr:VOC family protein [Labilithrix sp.]MCW5815223.1 VOC family protein [Labilithrix sp.]